RSSLDLSQRHLVVPYHAQLHGRVDLAQPLDQVVGERVVIVDEQDHGRSPARRKRRATQNPHRHHFWIVTSNRSDRKRIRLACTGAALRRCYSSMGPGRFRNRRPPGAMLVVRSRRGARAGRGASFERREGVMSATVVAVSLTLAMNSFGLG